MVHFVTIQADLTAVRDAEAALVQGLPAQLQPMHGNAIRRFN